jgi:CRP/FNR family transcriptional regulator, cyclic AMP receptor protein
MSECSITRLERGVVIEMLQQEPDFAALLLSYTLTRTIRIEEDLVDQLVNSS